jgi:hypothetical protein
MPAYEHLVIAFGPGQLAGVAAAIASDGRARVEDRGGRLFGTWKSLIGLSLNHVVVVVEWPDEAAARSAWGAVADGIADAVVEQHDLWHATLRPAPGFTPRHDGGFVTHRWYDIRDSELERFLELSSNTWTNWEGTHDGEVIGLWRADEPPAPGRIRMRLMAWYRDMGVWERSRHWKGTKGAETANQNLGARYDLTLDSAVSILQPL